MWNPAVTADSFRVAYNVMGSSTVLVKYVRSRNNLDINELLPATTYQWKVTAICAGSSIVSATEVFTTLNGPTDCGSTVVNTFTTNVTNSSAQLNWYGTRATSITIRYKKLGASSYTYKSLATNNTTAWGFNLSGLVSGTTYQWSVKTECGSVSSSYSSDNYFTTTSGCDVISGIAVSNVMSNRATVSWNPQSGVSYVVVKYAPATSSQWKYAYVRASAGQTIIRNLTPGVQYNIQLKSMCTYSNNSAYSAMERFTTGIARLGEATSELMINAYPNPADAQITYAFDAKKEGYFFIRVSDIAGRILLNDKKMASEGTNGGDIDLRMFTPGVYTLTITKGSEENHIRFEVNR
ncbi:MAG: fibronectin type III domain-containing protein [Bacteroidota bacterium]|nr:MAG: fibronectin type III domain-containing protein [Bacteroidota bacterium]